MKRLKQHIAYKSIFGIIVLLAAFFALVSVVGYTSFTETLLTQYAEGAFLTARTGALYLNPDRIEVYAAEGPELEEYQVILTELDRLCNSQGAAFVYVILPDRSDYGHITFLFSSKDHSSSYELFPFGYVRETTNEDYRTKYRALCEKRSEQELVIRDKGYISTDPHITAMVPLEGSDGEVKAILCVQRQMDALAKMRHAYLRRMLLVLIILVLLAIIGQSVYLNYTLLRPLRLISQEATRFSTEDVKIGQKLGEVIRSEDEVGQLALSIDRMEEQIQDYIENLKRITAEKQRIVTELELAARIQAAMVPAQFPPFPDRNEFDLWASMAPARNVGGDFYNYFLIDDDHLCMFIADVSGKGIPAALFMMASQIILSDNAMIGKTPGQILTDTNTAICTHNVEEMFVTVWLGILEISTGKLLAANAGHEYPILRKPGGSFEIIKDRHGFVMGGIDGIAYKEYELQLEPGSELFLYTDGVPEATDMQEQMFGTDRLLSELNKDSDASPRQLLKNVRTAVDGFVGEAEQFDDMTMLCMIYRG